MHCMLMDLLHGFEVLSTTEETLSFESVLRQGPNQNFSGKGAPNFVTVFKRSFFPSELILNYFINQNDSRRSERMLP